MTLIVHTARINCADPDRFDITRKSGGIDGHVFAPSWAILTPAIKARQCADGMRALAGGYSRAEDIERIQRRADELERKLWATYEPAYVAEMRRSYRENRAAWDALLARPRVVLVCYCVDHARCHRRLLAGILVKLGAEDRGEL